MPQENEKDCMDRLYEILSGVFHAFNEIPNTHLQKNAGFKDTYTLVAEADKMRHELQSYMLVPTTKVHELHNHLEEVNARIKQHRELSQSLMERLGLTKTDESTYMEVVLNWLDKCTKPPFINKPKEPENMGSIAALRTEIVKMITDNPERLGIGIIPMLAHRSNIARDIKHSYLPIEVREDMIKELERINDKIKEQLSL